MIIKNSRAETLRKTTQYTVNPGNHYGHKAFLEAAGVPDVLSPAILPGGSPESPNDYWDHVDYCLDAIQRRGMYAAVLPFWGRRYVNASHPDQSAQVFTADNIRQYGEFLGTRLQIIFMGRRTDGRTRY